MANYNRQNVLIQRAQDIEDLVADGPRRPPNPAPNHRARAVYQGARQARDRRQVAVHEQPQMDQATVYLRSGGEINPGPAGVTRKKKRAEQRAAAAPTWDPQVVQAVAAVHAMEVAEVQKVAEGTDKVEAAPVSPVLKEAVPLVQAAASVASDSEDEPVPGHADDPGKVKIPKRRYEGDVTRTQQAQAKERARKAKGPLARSAQVVESLARAVSHDAQKAAGAADAKAEVSQEEKEKADAEKLAAQRRKAQAQEAFIAEVARPLFPLYWHATPNPSSIAAALSQVAHMPGGLIRFPVMHTVIEANFQGHVRTLNEPYAKSEEHADVLFTPQMMDTVRSPGFYHEIEILITYRRYDSMLGEPRVEPGEPVWIPWEQWRYFCERRRATPLLSETLRSVIAYRADHQGVFHADNTPQSTNTENDQTFAAMATAQFIRAKGLDTVFFESVGQIITAQLERNVFKYFTADRQAPLAGGLYVEGYNVDFRQVWPTEWAQAVREVAEGADAREAVKRMISKVTACGFVRTAQTFVKDRLARMSEIHIADCLPVFPKTDVMMNLLSLIKRIGTILKPTTPAAAAYEEKAADGLIEMIQAAPTPEFTYADFEHELMEHLAHAPQLTEAEKEEFRVEALYAYGVISSGETEAVAFAERMADGLLEVKSFRKNETLPPEKIKTARGIACPTIQERAWLFALHSRSAEQFFRVMEGHTVKHMTPETFEDEVRENCGAWTGLCKFLSFDVTAFEGQVDERRRRLEGRVMAACAPPQGGFRAAIRAFSNRMAANGAVYVSQFWKLVRPTTNRRSGEYTTSEGNFICNASIHFSNLARALGIPEGDVPRFVRTWRMPWYVEGDDCMFAVPPQVVDEILSVQQESGPQFTINQGPEYGDAGFVGRKALNVGPRRALAMADVYAVLGRLTAWLDADPDSHNKDWDMLLARAMSYYLRYKDVPLVGPLCRRIVVSSRGRAADLMADAVAYEPKSPAARWLALNVLRPQGLYLEEKVQAICDLLKDLPPCDICPEARAFVAEQYPELNPSVQQQFEREADTVTLGEPHVFKYPEFTLIRKRLQGARDMVTHAYDDVRDASKLAAEKIKLAGTVTLGWAAVLWTRISLIYSCIAVIGPVVVALAGLAWTWWAILAAPVLWCCSLLGWAMGVLILWGPLGFSWTAARGTMGWFFRIICISVGIEVVRDFSSVAAWWISRPQWLRDKLSAPGKFASKCAGKLVEGAVRIKQTFAFW